MPVDVCGIIYAGLVAAGGIIGYIKAGKMCLIYLETLIFLCLERFVYLQPGLLEKTKTHIFVICYTYLDWR